MNYIKELKKDNAELYLKDYLENRSERLKKFGNYLFANNMISKEDFDTFSINSFIKIFIVCRTNVELITDPSKIPNYDNLKEKPIWFYIERWRLGDNNDGWSLDTIKIIDGLWVYLEEVTLKNINGTFIDINPVQDPNVMDYLKPTIQPDDTFAMGIYILNPIIINLFASVTNVDYNPEIEINNFWKYWKKGLGKYN